MTSQIKRVKDLLAAQNRRARKGLGQHFLVDRSYLKHIAGAAELGADDVVIEVGSGLGVLTEELVKAAGRVIAVEIDEALADSLPQASNLTVVKSDILATSPDQLLGADVLSYKVVANLPYNIASQVIRRFLEADAKPSLMVVMVQREVAKNMIAAPPQMNLLAVGVQLYGRPKLVCKVPPAAFYPRPRVDSAIVRIDVYDKTAVGVDDVNTFFRVVKAGFSTKRKQLHNSLSLGLGVPVTRTMKLLAEANIGHKRRAQTMTLDEWAKVARVFGDKYDNS